MSIATYLTALDRDRDALAANLTTKGVPASSSETFTTLVPKVLDIPSGGGGGVNIQNVTSAIGSGNVSTVAGYNTFAKMFTKLTVSDITLNWGGNSNGFYYGWAGIGANIEELTYDGVSFETGGKIIAHQMETLPSLKKLTVKNSGTSVSLQTFLIMHTAIQEAKVENTQVTSIQRIADRCTALKKLEIINSTPSTITQNFTWSFRGCSALELLDLSGVLITNSSASHTTMLDDVPTTCTIYVADATSQSILSGWYPNHTFTIKS